MPERRTPEPGQVVSVRQRRYLVAEVEASAGAVTDSPLVRLACLDDDAQGQPLEVLWNLELDTQVLTTTGWDQVATTGFDAPALFSAYIKTLSGSEGELQPAVLNPSFRMNRCQRIRG